MEENIQRQQVVQEEKSLSIKDIFHIIKKHLLGLIILTLAGIGGGTVYTVLEKPEWVAEASLIAMPDVIKTTTYTEVNGMEMLAETFTKFVSENSVINTVVEDLKLTYPSVTAKAVTSGLTVKNDSLFISVSYSSSIEQRSVDFANAVAKAAVKESNRQETDEAGNLVFEKDGVTPKYKYKLFAGNLQTVSLAEKSTKKSHAAKNILIGAAIGLVAAIAYIVIYELLDNSFRSEHELETELELPVLSTIPFYAIDDESTANKKKGGKK